MLHLRLSVVPLLRDNLNPFLLEQAGTEKVAKASYSEKGGSKTKGSLLNLPVSACVGQV